VRTQLKLVGFGSFHGRGYEECHLLAYATVWVYYEACSAYFSMRTVTSVMDIDTLKLEFCAFSRKKERL
jgi:hypothetical protein